MASHAAQKGEKTLHSSGWVWLVGASLNLPGPVPDALFTPAPCQVNPFALDLHLRGLRAWRVSVLD